MLPPLAESATGYEESSSEEMVKAVGVKGPGVVAMDDFDDESVEFVAGHLYSIVSKGTIWILLTCN